MIDEWTRKLGGLGARERNQNHSTNKADLTEINTHVCMYGQSLQLCPTLFYPMACSLPGSSVHGILRQEYWSGQQFPSPGHFPDPRIEPGFPAHSLRSKPSWKPSAVLLPSVFPNIRVFSSELALHIRWPKYWSFSFSISPSNEYSGLISFRINQFDLAVQGTLRSLLHLRKQKTYIYKTIKH